MDPKKDNQKKINTDINENFNSWKLDFMLLLIEYYEKYTETKNLTPTENILKWTNQYKENTDLYLSFLNECTEESTTHLKCSELYECYKFWFKNNNPNEKIPITSNSKNMVYHKRIKYIVQYEV